MSPTPSLRSRFKLRRFRLPHIVVPHVFVLLAGVIFFCSLLTWIVPSGRYAREERLVEGRTRTLLVPGTYQQLPKHYSLRGVILGEEVEGAATPVGLHGFLTAIPRGMEEAADIIFFIFVVGGVFGILQRTGVITASIGLILRLLGNNGTLLTIVLMAAMALGGSTLGMGEEFIPLIPVFLTLAWRLGYDRVYGMALVLLAADTGFAASTTNPFTVSVAQGIAEVKLHSGMGLRAVFLVCALTLAIIHLLRYGARVKRDPSRSLVADVPWEGDAARGKAGGKAPETTAGGGPGGKAPEATASGDAGGKAPETAEAVDVAGDHAAGKAPEAAPSAANGRSPAFRGEHGIILVSSVTIFAVVIVAVQRFGWWMADMGGGFLLMGFVAAVAARLSLGESVKAFVKGLEEMVVAALVVGFARGIAVVLADGQIIDTIIHGAATLLTEVPRYLAVVGMLGFEATLNFFIPSGSGQAAVSMPLMAPLADVLGLTRQVAVFAFTCGDGFSNMIIPTSGVLMAMLGLARIPYGRWLRFMLPLFLQLMALAAVFLVGAVLMDYR